MQLVHILENISAVKPAINYQDDLYAWHDQPCQVLLFTTW